MLRLELHLDHLVRLELDEERKAYLRRNPDLFCDEGARVLCRSAVASLYSDVGRSRALCQVLTILARLRRTPLCSAYRDHAWAAFHSSNGSDYRKALVKWQSAIARFDDAGRDDEAAITCSSALATSLYLDRLDLFWKWETRARLVFQENGDRLRLARLRANVAALYHVKSDWVAATKQYELAYEDFIAAGAPIRDTWVVLTNLAVGYTNLGESARAIQLLEKTCAECEAAGLHSAVARTDHVISNIKYLQGDLVAALKLTRRTATYARRNGMHHLESVAAFNESEILQALRLPRQAERCAQDALNGFVSLGMKLDEGKALTMLGLCLRMTGRHRRALPFYETAVQLFNKHGHAEGALDATLHQATSIFETGNGRLAASMAQDILDRASANPNTTVALGSRLLLAKVLLGEGKPDQALKLAEPALVRISLLDRPPMEAEALHLFARIHERLGDFRMAYDAYVRCEACLTRIRSQLTPGELKTSFLSDKTEVYEDLFSLGLRLGIAVDRLLNWAESGKSRTLAELLGAAARLQRSGARDQESTELEQIRTALQASMKHIDDLRLSIGPSAGPKVDHLSEGIETAARAVRKLIDHTPTSIHTGYSLTEIAMSLPPATSLVEFYFSRGSVFAFCISNRDCEVVPVARVDDVIRLHRLIRFQLRGRPRLGADTDAHGSLMQHLEGLHVLLWGSVAPLVTSRNIVVVPHGFLHQLPFHALFDGETFLIDRHAITYSPSAGVFCATRTRSDKGCASGNLVVGASDSDTPQVSSEVRAVAEMLPHTKVFLDDEATKARLLDELPRANVIHIAGHGYFSPTEPSDSAVAFGREPLTVRELQELNLRAELVVLSGCETGRSATKGSDEILGVTQALLRAGARSALVSLWKVDDESTACFMRQFYSELHHLSDRAEALRRAQIVHRTMFRHPFFWAPFVLVGDPMPSSTRTTPPRD